MDSDPELMTPALHVDFSGSDDDLDLNIPPSSGSEYLRRVRREAKQCPDVVVAKIDEKKLICKENTIFSNNKGCQPAPEGYAPSLNWQIRQIHDFSRIRMSLSQRQNAAGKAKVKLPDIEDDAGWCEFCFGKKLGDDNGLDPLVSVVLAMSQRLIEQVFDYHLAWFETTGFNIDQGRWFYSLLACLEKPLTPDVYSSLRTLVRYCANLRATLEKDDVRLPHLNLLICLVTRYFDQTDLADE